MGPCGALWVSLCFRWADEMWIREPWIREPWFRTNRAMFPRWVGLKYHASFCLSENLSALSEKFQSEPSWYRHHSVVPESWNGEAARPHPFRYTKNHPYRFHCPPPARSLTYTASSLVARSHSASSLVARSQPVQKESKVGRRRERRDSDTTSVGNYSFSPGSRHSGSVQRTHVSNTQRRFFLFQCRVSRLVERYPTFSVGLSSCARNFQSVRETHIST